LNHFTFAIFYLIRILHLQSKVYQKKTTFIMPAGPDETDNHASGAATEHVMKNSSSKTDNNASTHPIHDQGEPKGDKVEFRHHEAHPGPAIPKDFSAQEEGTKEERKAKAEALNK
jgi:hypothetical protein